MEGGFKMHHWRFKKIFMFISYSTKVMSPRNYLLQLKGTDCIFFRAYKFDYGSKNCYIWQWIYKEIDNIIFESKKTLQLGRIFPKLGLPKGIQ